MKARIWLTLGTALVVLARLSDAAPVTMGAWHSPLPLGPAPARPGRLLVKYRARVSACAHCLLAQGIPFASVTGTDSLDRLNRQLGVRAARALFFDGHAATGSRTAAYAATIDAVRAQFPQRSARVTTGATAPDLSNVFVLDVPRGVDIERAAARYAADPDVEYAHPDYRVQVSVTPDDPYFSSSGTWNQPYPDLWGLHLTQADSAWDTAIGTGTVVAVIDTGVDSNHPDIAANMWTNPGEIPNDGIDNDNNGFVDDVHGWDFVDNNNTPNDLFGHGTHVAGTVAAVGNNQRGVVGMAWGARVMAVRGLDAKGVGYTSDLAQAVLYAAQNGADVLNNSWGGFSFNLALGYQSALRDAVDTASSLGVVIVASAGNSSGSVDYVEPAGFPDVIAVGATSYTDTVASFSNHGAALSVAAPGVDILSLQSAVSPVNSFGHTVGSDYLRLSGTSMASPHAAGLAAVLLSAQPSLTPEEVRWHLELNADQPGYAGYEGQPWNPYFGWGRINAARVFDAPPVTTRLHGAADLHALTGQVQTDVAAADVSFTTLGSVAWSVASPPWLPPAVSAGSGAAHLSFNLDASGLAVGQYTGTVSLAAPGAVDGGGGFSATLRTHRDERLGAPVSISPSYVASSVPPNPVPVTADGVGEVAVWATPGGNPTTLYSARLDSAGQLSGPYLIDAGPQHFNPMVAFDGRNFLVTWTEQVLTPHGFYPHRYWVYSYALKALRISSSGERLDATPTVLMSRNTRREAFGMVPVQTVFDGTEYAVYWMEFNSDTDLAKIFARRVGIDGTLRGNTARIYPRAATKLTTKAWIIRPQFRCVAGTCLMVWGVRTGATSPTGLYLDDIYGVRLQQTALLDQTATHILSGINLGAGDPVIETDGTGYLVAATQVSSCPDNPICSARVMTTRVGAGGSVLDPAGNPLTDGAVPLLSLTFDGTNYIATFLGGGSRFGSQVFAMRFTPDGQVLDDEVPGLLLLPGTAGQVPATIGTPLASTITATPRDAILTWADTLGYDPNSSTVTWTNPISAQRVLAHAPAPGYALIEIGQIGPRSVAERGTLRFILSASTLNPAATTFTAANLPPGALLDSTGVFYWTPAANESGVYTNVQFQATDGVQSVSETVTITVIEANSSLGGTVTLSGGVPAVGITLKLRGMPGGARTVATDTAGRFRFDDLAAGNYRLALDRVSARQYRATPSTTQVALGSTDQRNLSLVVTAKP